jgi:hypothetical protein
VNNKGQNALFSGIATYSRISYIYIYPAKSNLKSLFLNQVKSKWVIIESSISLLREFYIQFGKGINHQKATKMSRSGRGTNPYYIYRTPRDGTRLLWPPGFRYLWMREGSLALLEGRVRTGTVSWMGGQCPWDWGTDGARIAGNISMQIVERVTSLDGRSGRDECWYQSHDLSNSESSWVTALRHGVWCYYELGAFIINVVQ